MEKIIKAAIDRGASDLHIKAGDVFRARIDGKLVAMTKQALTPEQTRADRASADHERKGSRADRPDHRLRLLLGSAGHRTVPRQHLAAALELHDRYAHHPVQSAGVADLGLPPVYERISETERGMVLVTGVTGSGKSSSLAAMMRHQNETMELHIVTLEEPIEFLHRDIRCSITQREVGTDTESFRLGLRAALRQDPDVIVLGELRDAETIDTAMKAAETGTCSCPRCTRLTRRRRSCA
jgi:twitching motility protein PilT